METADTLGELVKSFARIPSENGRALQTAFQLAAAQAIVVELASHLAKDLDVAEAMNATARGDLQLPEQLATVFHLLTVKPKS
jgi:hypothetical protein